MKLLAYFLACLLILSNTTDAEASPIKDIYSDAEEQIAHYYEAGGEWNLNKIDNMEIMNSESNEYILVCAKTRIVNLVSGKKTKQTCLLSFIQDNSEFNSINCF